MPRYRLRHGSTVLDLPAGDFVVGRSTQANLTLDDPLVSRRHARIFPEGDEVFIEDLGSRNGFTINGAEHKEKIRIRHLDRIRIGNTDLVLLDERSEGVGTAERGNTCRQCGAPVGTRDRHCSRCGTRVGGEVREHQTMEIQLPAELRKTSEPSRAGAAFALVGGIASKALAMGRIDEADRMIGAILEQVLQRVEGGENVDAGTIRESVDFATKLLEGSAATKWITYLLRIHERLRRVPESTVVEALHEAVRRSRYSDPRPIARLVEVTSANAAATPAERFVIKRLEALQRVVSAG